MTTCQITENAKAILLLCGHFGRRSENGPAPLNIREYNEVANWLQSKKWWPADLLDGDKAGALDEALVPLPAPRLKGLLARGAVMAMAIEKWTNKGFWVLCRSDGDYPQRLKQHLKRNAPPILYGAGERSLLEKGGLAVVGSRNIDSAGEQFAEDVGRCSAEAGMQVVSGGAKGADETAMLGAFAAGGTVVGVMADSLLRRAVSGKYRQGIRDGQLLLVSTYNPEARFSVGAAMGRNKYIYALADYAVVVNSAYNKGGTWAGAEEELKREASRPVFVRIGEGVSRGNPELIKLGARPFPSDGLQSNLLEALERTAEGGEEDGAEASPELPPTTSAASAEPFVKETDPAADQVQQEPLSAPVVPTSVLEAVTPLILQTLDKPRTSQDVAKTLKVRKPQMDDWLRQLVKDQVLEKRMVRKSRKFSVRNPDEEFDLT